MCAISLVLAGLPFELSAADFPLRLSVLSVNASMRGEEAWSAAENTAEAIRNNRPELMVSFRRLHTVPDRVPNPH